MTIAVVDINSEQVYEIEEAIESSSAFVCIARAKKDKKQKLVFKILREYKDERYHYGSPKERLLCQKEALRKNRMITPDIYLGLARISSVTLQELEEMKQTGRLQSIMLGTIVQDSDQIEYTSVEDGEYALVMSYLSQEQRLDLLLQEEGPKEHKELFLQLLATRIGQLHKDFLRPATKVDGDGDIWGSYKQLSKKLQHNLMHFDLIGRYNLDLYAQYSGLKEALEGFIKQKQLQKAFEARRNEYVKQCHGDLKTNNIWIEPIKQDDHSLHCVRILDAVDFNESYRNIDVLADLAMLVVDVEAIGNEELGTILKEKYLSLTEQTGDAAGLVLAYYLLEKAIVGAIVCIVYDRCEPPRGQRFLDLAKKHAGELEGLINPPIKANSASNAA